MNKESKVKVFISYSHDSDEHRKFIRELADKLKPDGIDCLIDQDIKSPQGPPQGWRKWMMEKIEWADFVLVMFTPMYAKSWRGDSDRRGSTYEGAIITQQIYDNFGRNEKFIPVIREKGDPNDVQFPLNNFSIYTLMKGYDSLHSSLTGQPSLEKTEKQAENNDESNDCPYCGIFSFTEEDQKYFFGREDFIDDQLIPAIEKKSLPFISLFGATGVGKSSVVFAGLIPKIKRRNWKCVNFEPGNDPFYSLAQTLITPNNQVKDISKLAKALKEEQCLPDYLAVIKKNLSQDNRNLLIVIDKFEKIYRDKPNESHNGSHPDQVNQGFKFLRCLLGGIKWLKENSDSNRIVFLAITTSEGHSKTADFPDHAELYNLSTNIPLTGLKPEDMRRVIEEPAKRKKVFFEGDLVDTIQRDAGQEPGMLPLLEVTLRQLWRHRTGDLIKKDTYKTLGGVRKTLANYADSCIEGLENKNYQEIAKDIFLQIIDAREDLINTKNISAREIRVEDLTAREKNPTVKENTIKVVDKLVDKRLLVKESQGSKRVLKIPHDTLIKHWPQVNDWLNQDARNRFFINDLGKRAEEWQKSGFKVSHLDSGSMLELTEDFFNKNSNDFRLNDLMKEFHLKGIENKRNNEMKKTRYKILIGSLLAFIVFAYSVNEDKELKLEKSKLEASQADVKRKEAEIKIEQEELMHRGTQEQLARAIKGKYLSSGEKTHFAPPNTEKRHGNDYFKNNEYEKAELKFKKSRENSLDDPEALIYSNNAKAFFSKNYLTIVASVPIKYSNDIAKEMLRGIALAQNEINSRGGIKKKLLHVAIADDNNDPTDVWVIANYLVNDNSDKEVLAVIGSNVSEATKQAAEIYQGKMIMISPTSFAVNFDEIKEPENGENYIFSVIGDYKAVMPKLVNHIVNTIAHPKLLVCDDSKAYDQKVFRNFFEEEGFSLKEEIKENRCDLNNIKASYEKIVDKAVRSGINSVFIAPHVSRIDEGINLARYVRTEYPDLKLFGSPTLYNATTLKNGKDTIGLVIPVHWFPDVRPHPFYKEATELWGRQNITGTTWRTATSYDAVYVIATALGKIGINDELNRENLQQQLIKEDFKYEGVSGEIRFKKNGARVKSDPSLIEATPCHEGCPHGYKYGFYRVD
jgi:branched-chain amino acid transport system substrate-binding protein